MDNLSQSLPAQDQKNAKSAPRRAVPRLGAFVTIAASLLLLFGAASRIGKVPETVALFGIDNQAEIRIRQDEERQRTALMIGSVPVNRNEVRPPRNSVRLDPEATPPSRGEFDIDTLRRPAVSEPGRESTLSLSIPQNVTPPEEDIDAPANGPAAGAQQAVRQEQTAHRPKTYKVQNGDTWVKVAKRTLGDANRWRELLSANPTAQNGLRVGMDLVVPGDN